MEYLTNTKNSLLVWVNNIQIPNWIKIVYSKLTNPTFNILSSMVFILAFEVFTITTFGIGGFWYLLMAAALSTCIFLVRVEELDEGRKFKTLAVWYITTTLFVCLNPMGWGLNFVTVGWAEIFFNSVYVSALYTIPVSLLGAIFVYKR